MPEVSAITSQPEEDQRAPTQDTRCLSFRCREGYGHCSTDDCRQRPPSGICSISVDEDEGRYDCTNGVAVRWRRPAPNADRTRQPPHPGPSARPSPCEGRVGVWRRGKGVRKVAANEKAELQQKSDDEVAEIYEKLERRIAERAKILARRMVETGVAAPGNRAARSRNRAGRVGHAGAAQPAARSAGA